MNRRQFLIRTGTAAAAVAGAVAIRRATVPEPSIEALVAELTTLRGTDIASLGAWSPAATLVHLAQSVEYSMSGYPQLKPAAFRRTAGPAAFFVFATAGAMRHNLSEPIPGAPALDTAGSSDDALARLVDALSRFQAFDRPLQPHFAYGALDHRQYRAAHVYHVRDHLRELRIAPPAS